jgi:hypothetical protein
VAAETAASPTRLGTFFTANLMPIFFLRMFFLKLLFLLVVDFFWPIAGSCCRVGDMSVDIGIPTPLAVLLTARHALGCGA